jgi:hypothetical protein
MAKGTGTGKLDSFPKPKKAKKKKIRSGKVKVY